MAKHVYNYILHGMITLNIFLYILISWKSSRPIFKNLKFTFRKLLCMFWWLQKSRRKYEYKYFCEGNRLQKITFDKALDFDSAFRFILIWYCMTWYIHTRNSSRNNYFFCLYYVAVLLQRFSDCLLHPGTVY